MFAGCPAMGATLGLCRPRSDLALVVLCLRLDPRNLPAPRGLCRLLGGIASPASACLSAMWPSAQELDGSLRPLPGRLLELRSVATGRRRSDGGVRVRRPGSFLPATGETPRSWRDPLPTRRATGPRGGRLGFLRRLHRAGADPLPSRLEPATRLCAGDGAGATVGTANRIEDAEHPGPSTHADHRRQAARSPRSCHPGAIGIPLPKPGRRRAFVARRRCDDHGNDDRRLRAGVEGGRRD